jgi:tRNA(adenine34) deaminase
MRMLTYYINRAGKELSATRRRDLEKAKDLLSEKVKKEREKTRKNKDKA